MVDEAPILLVAGLGNPGRRYVRTWHNMGYMALDFWAAGKGLTFKPGRGDYTYLEYHSKQGVITFLKPTSYMNLSGVPVGEVARYRKLDPQNILVVCDDIALPLGTIRFRQTGSSGGHKGIDSIIGQMRTEAVPRMRMGIFLDGWPGDLSDFVLSRIPEAIKEDVSEVLKIGAEALDCVFTEGITVAMNRFNRNFLDEDTES